jgi:hypothetical protein
MKRPATAWFCALATAVAATLPTPAVAQGHAHVHGQARLDVVIDGEQLVLTLASPLDSIVGFEHAPKTAAQRQAAEAALTALADGARLFAAPAEAACVLAGHRIDAPVLRGAAGDGHADLEAEYRFRCARPAALTQLQVRLFDALPRLQRLDAQVAGPAGQGRRSLRRGATTLKIAG